MAPPPPREDEYDAPHDGNGVAAANGRAAEEELDEPGSEGDGEDYDQIGGSVCAPYIEERELTHAKPATTLHLNFTMPVLGTTLSSPGGNLIRLLPPKSR